MPLMKAGALPPLTRTPTAPAAEGSSSRYSVSAAVQDDDEQDDVHAAAQLIQAGRRGQLDRRRLARRPQTPARVPRARSAQCTQPDAR